MPRKSKPLVREGEPKQRTKTGLEIPIPKKKDFDRLLKQVAVKRERPHKS